MELDATQEEIVKQIVRLWKDNPRLRFGQLVSNTFGMVDHDPFYIQDTDMLALLLRLDFRPESIAGKFRGEW